MTQAQKLFSQKDSPLQSNCSLIVESYLKILLVEKWNSLSENWYSPDALLHMMLKVRNIWIKHIVALTTRTITAAIQRCVCVSEYFYDSSFFFLSLLGSRFSLPLCAPFLIPDYRWRHTEASTSVWKHWALRGTEFSLCRWITGGGSSGTGRPLKIPFRARSHQQECSHSLQAWINAHTQV